MSLDMVALEIDYLIRRKVQKSLDAQGARVGPRQFDGFVERESEVFAKFLFELWEAEDAA